MTTARSFASVDIAAGRLPPPDPVEEADILRQIILGLPTAIAYIDPDDSVRLANDAYMAMMNCTRADLAPLMTTERRLRWQFETGRQPLTHDTIEASIQHALRRQVTADGLSEQCVLQGRIYEHRFVALPGGRWMTVYQEVTGLEQQKQELRKTLDYVAAMNEWLKAVALAPYDLNAVLTFIITKAVELSGAERGILYRYHQGICRYETGFNVPPGYEEIEFGREILPDRGTGAGRALLERRGIHIHDVMEDPDYTAKRQAAIGSVRTLLCVPLMRGGEPVCILALIRSTVAPFNEREIDLVSSFAEQAAIALENARLLHELQQAHEDAEHERAMLRAVLDNVSDGIGLCDPDGRIALWNNAMYEINSYPMELFRTFQHVRQSFRYQVENGYIPREYPTIEEDIEAAERRFQLQAVINITRQRPNGRWVEIRWSSLPDGRRLCTHHDITELKQRELELREIRTVMESVLDNMTDGVMLWNKNGNWRYANKSLYRMQATTPARLAELGNLAAIVTALLERGDIRPSDADRYHRRFQIADGTPEVRRFGVEGWTEASLHLLPNGDRLGIYRDITTLKNQEIALTEQTAELRETLDFQSAVADVLRVISHTPFDLDSVLDTMLRRAVILPTPTWR